MNRVIVISGGSSGLGKQVRKLFEEESGNIVLSISRNVDESNEREYACDVSDEKAVEKIFNIIAKKYGKIDLLLNNAGFGLSGITELIKPEEAKRLFDVNFFGAWYCVKSALPHMPKGGRIVNIGSAMEFFPVPYRAFYASSKSALDTLSQTLRMECKPLGVDVTCVCPGDIKTEFTKNRVKDFETNERYGEAMKKATLKVDARENKRMSVESVAKKLFKICNKKKTKPMYLIGAKYKFIYFLSKFFPLSLKLKVISKVCWAWGWKPCVFTH